MATLTTLTIGELEITVEGEPVEPAGIARPTGLTEDIQKKYSDLAQFITDRSSQFVAKLEGLGELAPTSFGLELEIGIEVSSGVPFIAKGKGTGSITVKAEWKRGGTTG